MKIYLDLQKQAITKTTDENIYQGDIYSNAFEILFYNYTDSNWFPTMSQLAPNGRKAGEFTADALDVGESHEYTEDGVTYLKFTFTMGTSWVLMKGRSEFYIWFNRLGGAIVQKKCVGVVNIMIDHSTEDYFIADPTFNPNVKAYIDACIAELGDGSPKYFDTASNIANLTEDKGLAVATDTGHLYYWDETKNTTTKYTDSGLVYNDLSAYYTKTETNTLLAQKQDNLTFDSTPTANSTNPVTSGGVKTALDEVNASLNTKASTSTVNGIDNRVGTLENEITDLQSVQNVVDVVATKSALNSYNTSKLEENDKIQVIADETHDGASTIYNWNGSAWQYVGAYGTNSYTKQESDNKFAPKTTAVIHTGNQLQDYSGNNILPVIDETKINLLDGEVDGIFVVSKNILDMDNITRTEGKYLNISNGNESTNASYFYTNEYIPVEPNTTYYVNSWKKSDDTQLSMIILGCLYDEHKTYISGFNSDTFTTPSNCYFLRFSTVIDAYNYRHISISKTVLTSFVPYYKIIKNSLTEEKITIKCASSGTADFRNLRKCLESITDASKDRQYVVELAEGTYDFTNDITNDELADNTFKGIFVPDFVTIKGIGNVENTIIQLTLTAQNNNISTLNMRNTAGLENLTIKGTNTRYVIHDDFTDNSAEVYYRTLKNVRIIGTTCSLSTCYGCGAHSGMIAKFENCVFDGTNVLTLGGNGIPFLIHNNVEWTHSVHFTFDNCRMLTSGSLPDNVGSSRGGLLLRTLQHAYNNSSKLANMFVYVTIKGCELNDIVFREENATYYGTGCMFKVNGYGNKTDDYRIYVTDSVDYSSYVDLI